MSYQHSTMTVGPVTFDDTKSDTGYVMPDFKNPFDGGDTHLSGVFNTYPAIPPRVYRRWKNTLKNNNTQSWTNVRDR